MLKWLDPVHTIKNTTLRRMAIIVVFPREVYRAVSDTFRRAAYCWKTTPPDGG